MTQQEFLRLDINIMLSQKFDKSCSYYFICKIENMNTVGKGNIHSSYKAQRIGSESNPEYVTIDINNCDRWIIRGKINTW